MSPDTTHIRLRRDLQARLDEIGRRLDRTYSLKPHTKPDYWGTVGDQWNRSDVIERLIDHFEQHARRSRRRPKRARDVKPDVPPSPAE